MLIHSGELMMALLPLCLALRSLVQVSIYHHGSTAQLIEPLMNTRGDHMGLTPYSSGHL